MHSFYGNYAGQPILVGTPGSDLQDFVGAKFKDVTVHMPLLTAIVHSD